MATDMPEANEPAAGQEDSPASWGQVGVVLLTDYDYYDRLKKLRAAVQAALDLLASLGFEVTDDHLLTQDGRTDSLVRGIHTWRPASSRLIIYWAGHGKAIEGGRLFLCSRDTMRNQQPDAYNSVPASNLGDLLAGKDVSEIVLLLDTCGAGGGAEEIVSAFRAKADSRTYASGFKPGLVVISSAGRNQQAREGALSSALVNVLRNGPPADQSYLAWTERDEYLDPAEVFLAVRVQLALSRGRGMAQVPEHDATGGVGRFFPNPRYRKRVPDVGVAEKQRRAVLLPSDVAEHFMLKFRGIDTVDDRGWFFTGRERLLRRLASWLGGVGSGLLVITGPPGCGKSAVLGRIAVLSVPEYRAKVAKAGGLADVPPDTIPPKRSIDAGVHAKNLSLTECIAELADALQLPAPSAGWRSAADFIRQVAALKRQVTLLVDALDEAQPADVHTLAVDLLRPLAEIPNVKLLVGTRPDRPSRDDAFGNPAHGSLLYALAAGGSEIIRLDQDEDTAADITSYVRRRLLETAGSPYEGRPIVAADMARLIAQRSDRIFLIARLLAQEFIRRGQIVSTSGPGGADARWQMLEGSLADAFTADLARFGQDEWRLRALLAPLAFAEGAGMPSRDVWLAAAEALRPVSSPAPGQRRLTAADLSWIVRHAGAYLIESGEDGQTVYRLYHQAFADYFRAAAPLRETQRRITDALVAHVETESKRHWNLANPYTLRHGATHAAAAGRLDGLVADSRYLLYAEPEKLQRVLARTGYRDAPLTRLYWRCVDDFPHATPTERAAIMQGVALRDEPDALPLLNTEPELPWQGRWGEGLRAAFHRRLPSHASPVTAIACGRSPVGAGSRRTVLLATAAGDGVVRLWNAETGEQWNRFENRSGIVFALAFCTIGQRQLLIAGGQDGSVRFWDVVDGRPARSIEAHKGPVFALTLAETMTGPVLATAGEDGYVRLWRLETGERLGELRGHHTAVRALAFGAGAAGPVLVSGGDDGRVRIWDPQRQGQLNEFGGMGWIYAVALGRVGGRPVVATGSSFGTVRLWDLTTHTHKQSFVGHDGSVSALAFGELAGQTLLATGGDDGAIRLWNPRDGSLYQTLTRSATEPMARPANPTATVLALGSGLPATDNTDSSPEDVLTGAGRAQSIQALEWVTVAGQPTLISGDGDWVARLWQPTVGGTVDQNHRVGLVRILAAGRAFGFPMIAEGCEDRTVRLRSADTGRELRTLDARRMTVTAVAAGLVDSRLVITTASEDGKVVLHDAMTGTELLTLSVQSPSAPVAFAEQLILADIAGNASLVTANSYAIEVWNPRTGVKTGSVPGCESGTRLALGEIVPRTQPNLGIGQRTILISANRRGDVAVTDLASGRVTDLPGHDAAVNAVAFGQDAHRDLAITAGEDATIRVWDLAESAEVQKLTGHQGPVNTVAFGHIGPRPILISGGQDGTVRLWNPGSGENLGFLANHAGPVTAVITFEDNDGQPLVCTGAQDGTHLVQLSAALFERASSAGPATPKG
jgi:WD40 repeat protein